MSRINPLSDKAKADIVRMAAVWWNMTGRHLVRPAINETKAANDVRIGKGLPTFIIKHAPEKDLNDGILLARKWDDLTKDEAARVVQAFVRYKFIPEHTH